MIPIPDSGVVRRGRPVVSFGIIAICTVVFIYELSLGGLDRDIFFFKYGLIPSELTSGEALEILPVRTPVGILGVDIASPIPTWGTVFTSMFIHGGILHLVANMLFLWGFGEGLEGRLGHVKYLLFYLGVGIAAAWTQIATNLDSQTPIIGASGAIFGVIGAFLLAYPYNRTIALLFVFLILPMFFNFGSLGISSSGSGIAYMAHVGGLVAGVLFMAGYKFLAREPILPRRLRRPWQD